MTFSFANAPLISNSCLVSEDAETLARAQNNNVHKSPGSKSGKEDRGMYTSLSLHHLYTLLDCLLQAHRYTLYTHIS